MEFRILGPVEVWDGGRRLDVGGPKPRTVLAALLLHAHQTVSADRLIDELWGETPPATARNVLQCHVARLRRALHRPAEADGPTPVLLTRPGGYLLRIEPGQLDLHRFQEATERGRRAMAAGDAGEAAEQLRRALAFWRGPALADVASESLRRTAAAPLEEARLVALEERLDADLALGRHTELVGELEALVAAYPDRERPRRQLMLALYRSGRPTEALEAYRSARSRLAEEFGLEPSPALQQLERAMLLADPTLEAPPLAATEHPPGPASPPGPCQLPPDIDDLTGREAALAELEFLLTGDRATAVVITAIAGKAGVGKTALAVRLAHRLRSQFPDGQLYVNLRGAEAQALDPADVLAGFLRALGVESAAIADGLDERSRQFRSRLAGNRVLVVLDNAAGEAQVRPLLPGGRGCAALVTSRVNLPGLEAAHPLTLDVLDPDQAVTLLATLAGPAQGGRRAGRGPGDRAAVRVPAPGGPGRRGQAPEPAPLAPGGARRPARRRAPPARRAQDRGPGGPGQRRPQLPGPRRGGTAAVPAARVAGGAELPGLGGRQPARRRAPGGRGPARAPGRRPARGGGRGGPGRTAAVPAPRPAACLRPGAPRGRGAGAGAAGGAGAGAPGLDAPGRACRQPAGAERHLHRGQRPR